YSMRFAVAANEEFENLVLFDGAFGTGWKYSDGTWLIRDKTAFIDGHGKRCFGDNAWRDYTVEADILFSRNMNAGLIFRVNNPALGGAGNDPALGTDYLQGYFAGFNFGTVVLGKHNYGWKSLATSPGTFTLNTWYHIRAVVAGNRIRIYVDDMTQPVIDYTDPFPFINGMAGLRSFNTGVNYDNFHVTSQLLISSEKEHPVSSGQYGMDLYPNPATDQVFISFHTAESRKIRLTDPGGKILHTATTSETELSIPVQAYEAGIYILTVETGNFVESQKLILYN
ncbi:MAG: T9SS type A sorting domain-containing protein, partial [Bacteroidales bacterium]|nr:T9SS type A sorting domain-containing protein [Bacteroidales bacterium]